MPDASVQAFRSMNNPLINPEGPVLFISGMVNELASGTHFLALSRFRFGQLSSVGRAADL
jgi:hypothetical protein